MTDAEWMEYRLMQLEATTPAEKRQQSEDRHLADGNIIVSDHAKAVTKVEGEIHQCLDDAHRMAENYSHFDVTSRFRNQDATTPLRSKSDPDPAADRMIEEEIERAKQDALRERREEQRRRQEARRHARLHA